MIKIIKNDRVNTGYKDSNLKCTRCGGVTTRYIKIDTQLLCRTCLYYMDEKMKQSLLEVINGIRTN